MKGAFVSVLASWIVLAVAGALQAGIHIELKDEADVSGAYVRLQDVARVQGDDAAALAEAAQWQAHRTGGES